jgi:hypothetical protein
MIELRGVLEEATLQIAFVTKIQIVFVTKVHKES